MASTYVNDLRIEEQATGENSGTWGTKVNSAFSQIAEAFSYGTKQLAADSNETFTMPDGTSDGTRSLYLKITSAGSLTATRTVTLGPNTVSKLWIIENATTGSQSITIAQGSGGTVTIPTGAVKIVYSDGAGSGAAVVDALVDLDLTGTTKIATANIDGGSIDGTTIGAATAAAGTFTTGDFSGLVQFNGTAGIQLDNAAQVHSWTLDDNFTSRLNIGTSSASAAWKIGSNNNAYLTVSPSGIDVTGTVTADGLTVDGNATISVSDNSDNLTLISTDTDANAGPNLLFKRDNNSAAGDDLMGSIVFQGEDAGNNLTDYVAFKTQIQDPTGGSEDGRLKIELMSGGTSRSLLDASGSNAIVFNEDGQALNFRVESSGNANMLFVDGTNDRVGIGTASPSASLHTSGGVAAGKFESTGSTYVDIDNGTVTGRLQTISSDFFIGTATTGCSLAFKSGNNVEAMRIDSSGSVGIGVVPSTWAAAWTALDIGDGTLFSQNNRTTGLGSNIYFTGSAWFPKETGESALYQISQGTHNWYANSSVTSGVSFTPTTKMTLDASGNLLVGKSATTFATEGIVAFSSSDSNGSRINITNDGGETLNLNRNTSDGNLAIFYKDSTAVGSIGTTAGDIQIGSGDTALRFQASTDSVFPAEASGGGRGSAIDLGLSSVPFKDLYLSGKAQADSYQFAQNSSATGATEAVYRPTTGQMAFKTNSSEAMRIDSSGNLLVGRTTSTVSTFEIEGSGGSSSGAKFGFLSLGNSGTGYPFVGYNCAPTTTPLTYNRYATDYASWVDFTSGQVRTFTTTAVATGNTTGTAGPYVARGGTSWTSSSDRRLKDDIQEISYGIDAVKSLAPVSYIRNDRDVEGRELGFIAQDVEGVVDEVVDVTDDGYYGIDYQRLVPVLTKAIQEQQDLIESLTARIAALEGAN